MCVCVRERVCVCECVRECVCKCQGGRELLECVNSSFYRSHHSSTQSIYLPIAKAKIAPHQCNRCSDRTVILGGGLPPHTPLSLSHTHTHTHTQDTHIYTHTHTQTQCVGFKMQERGFHFNSLCFLYSIPLKKTNPV